MIPVKAVGLGLFTVGLLLIISSVYYSTPLLAFEILKDFKIAKKFKNLFFFRSLEIRKRKG